MSEVQSRPARGRTTARGGRGGGAARGTTRPSKHTNGETASSNTDTTADQGELGELKRRYQSQLSTLKELFPDWTDLDLLVALEESDGDLPTTIESISEGNVSQFAEVKNTKDRSRSKVKDMNITVEGGPHLRGGARPERRGGDSIRGGRGRGADRGRGGFRGAARGGAAAAAPRTGGASVPTAESTAWDVPKPSAKPKEAEEAAAKDQAAPEPSAPKAAAPAPTSAPARTWASLVATPKVAPAPPKPAPQPQAPPAEPSQPEPLLPAAAEESPAEPEESPAAQAADDAEPATETPADSVEGKEEEAGGTDTEIPPSKNELTKDNVEHLPDASHPPPTETAASTVASVRDIGVATPLSTAGQAPISRPAAGGYATTALKATGGSGRSASFQRKRQEQQEAVVMPGNHAVDHAAVQFGSLGLNGDEADNLDVDEDREDAETRTQPPQHSPVAQPRAALPPAPRQAPPAAEPQSPEAVPAPKQAPGLPPPPQQPLSQQSPTASVGAQPAQPQGAQNQGYNQFGRYGQQPDAMASQQKPYDPFSQQGPQLSQYDYAGQQSHSVGQQPHSQAGGFSSAPDSFASQYLTSENQRYQNYYGTYNQQNTQSPQEAGIAQQRSGSAFGAGPTDSAFPPGQQQQSRYNDAQNSGNNTPNPALGGQQPTGPASQAGPMHQPQGQHGHGNYPYNHPYFNNPYYTSWATQPGQFSTYPASYGGYGQKMYGQQSHHYAMSPQTSFEQHSASPVGAFGGSHGRDAGGLGEYGRSVSQASQNQHGATAGSFGGLSSDPFRSQGNAGPGSFYGQQQGGQQSPEDSLKPFGESKSQGPSPSALGAQPGRPGSAANNAPQSGQGLPPQSHQPGFGGAGGYPGHLGGQNNYGGLGGLGHQGGGSHQGGGAYGSYGGFGGNYGGSYSRGGWGNSYGQH